MSNNLRYVQLFHLSLQLYIFQLQTIDNKVIMIVNQL